MAGRTVRCGASGQTFEVPPGHPGGTLACPFCGQVHAAPPTAINEPAPSERVERVAATAVTIAEPPPRMTIDVRSSRPPSAPAAPRRPPIFGYALAVFAGAAGGVVLGLMLAMAIDSPRREALRRHEELDRELASVRSDKAEAEAKAGELAAELSAGREAIAAREAELKTREGALDSRLDEERRSIAKMTGAVADELIYQKRSLDVGVEEIERRLERFAALKFEPRPPREGKLDAWIAEADVIADGFVAARCTLEVMGRRDDLAIVIVETPYRRDRSGDADGMLVPAMLAELCCGEQKFAQWQAWFVRGIEAVSRDRQVCCVKGNVLCTLGMTDDARSLYVLLARP